MFQKYKVILTVIMLSFASLFISAWYFFMQAESNSQLINKASQQRMLLQQVAFSANTLLSTHDHIQYNVLLDTMESSLDQLALNHQLLTTGKLSKGLQIIYFKAPYELDEHVKHFILFAQNSLEKAQEGKLDEQSIALRSLTDLALHELLQALDMAVWQYKIDAERERTFEQRVILALFAFMLFGLLLGAYELYVFMQDLRIKNKLLKLNNFVFDYAVDGIITADGEGVIITANERVRELMGYAPGAMIGRKLASFIEEIAVNKMVFSEMMGTIDKLGEWRGEIIQQSDTTKPISVGVRAVYEHADLTVGVMRSIVNYVMVITDISEQKDSEDQLLFLSMHDQLTGLFNRNAMYREYNDLVSIASSENQKLNVMMMDLDGFKLANDTFSHEAGDHVLKVISQRMQSVLRDSDVLARFGGDEFVVLAPQGRGDSHPEKVAEKILAATAEPVLWQGDEINIGVSIGIAAYPDDGDDLDALIRKADVEMYKVKKQGKNNFSMCCKHYQWSQNLNLPDS